MGGRIQHYSDESPDVRGNLEQQQQQPPLPGPLLWAQVRDSIDVTERRRGLRSAYESVEVGKEALEHLDDQKGRISEHVQHFCLGAAQLIPRCEMLSLLAPSCWSHQTSVTRSTKRQLRIPTT